MKLVLDLLLHCKYSNGKRLTFTIKVLGDKIFVSNLFRDIPINSDKVDLSENLGDILFFVKI